MFSIGFVPPTIDIHDWDWSTSNTCLECQPSATTYMRRIVFLAISILALVLSAGYFSSKLHKEESVSTVSSDLRETLPVEGNEAFKNLHNEDNRKRFDKIEEEIVARTRDNIAKAEEAMLRRQFLRLTFACLLLLFLLAIVMMQTVSLVRLKTSRIRVTGCTVSYPSWFRQKEARFQSPFEVIGPRRFVSNRPRSTKWFVDIVGINELEARPSRIRFLVDWQAGPTSRMIPDRVRRFVDDLLLEQPPSQTG